MGPCRPRVELALYYTIPNQSEISRSVVLLIFTLCRGVVNFHTVRGDINPGDTHPCLFPSCRSCICVCGINYDPGMGPNIKLCEEYKYPIYT